MLTCAVCGCWEYYKVRQILVSSVYSSMINKNATDIVFQCPCFYIFSKKSLPLLDSFMNEKQVSLKFKPIN